MNERRRRRRFALRCTVEFEKEGRVLASTTTNISSQGFYCVVDQAVTPGEELRCVVDLMEGHAALSLPAVSLRCEVVVLRSEQRAEGQGIACRIKNYTVARSASSGTHGRAPRGGSVQ